MADRKISELTSLTGAQLADDDVLVIVDTSANETKKISYTQLRTRLDDGTGFVRITGDKMTGVLSVEQDQDNTWFEGINGSESGFRFRIYNDGTTVNSPFTRLQMHHNGNVNSAINFYRGSGATGGWLSFGTNDGTERMTIGNTGTVQVNNAFVANEDGGDSDFRVESDTNANAIFVDASANAVGMGITSSPEAASSSEGLFYTIGGSFVVASNTETVKINRNGTGGNNRVNLGLYNNGTKRGEIGTYGAADGLYFFVGSSSNDAMRLQVSDVVFNQAGADRDFRVESDTNANALFLDAGTSMVGINQAPVDAYLHIKGQFENDYAIKFNNTMGNGLAEFGYRSHGTNGETFALYDIQHNKKMVTYNPSVVVYNEDSNDVDFRVESNSRTHALFVDGGNDLVGINHSGGGNDASLVVISGDPKHPAAKFGSHSNVNGFNLIGDNYQGDETVLNIGMGYSGGNPIFARSVKPSTTQESAFISSQDTFAAKPAALEIKNDGFRFYHTKTSATTAVDSPVTLTNMMHISGEGTIVNDAGINADFRIESDNLDKAFFVDASADAVQMGTSENAARLNIGTPANKKWLHLRNEDESAFHFQIYNDGTNEGSTVPFVRMGLAHGANRNAFINFYRGGSSTGGFMNFTTNTDIERMKIAGDGVVTIHKGLVINEGSNDSDFRVETDTNANAILVDASTNNITFGSSAGTAMYDGSSTNAGIQFELSYGTVVHQANGNANYYMSKASGYSNGTFLQLSVAGTQRGSITTDGTGVTYNTVSDRRLKTDIQPIADGTEKLMAMNPVTHKWKADEEADTVVGFIAQEMQEIVPEAVLGDPDGEEMMSMDYGRITPVLVAALQDAHKKIEALEERLAELEAN